MGEQYVVIRSGQSGVWFGVLVEGEEAFVRLGKARKIWSWVGAKTTTHIALNGVDAESFVTAPIDDVVVGDVCEILPATEAAVARMAAVPVW